VRACPTHGDQLAAYALGALEPDDAEAMRRHIETCAICREQLPSMSSLPRLLDTVDMADVPPPQPPAWLEESLLDQIARETPRHGGRRGRTRRRVLAGALAAAATVAVAVLAIVLSGDDDEAYARANLGGKSGARAYARLEAVPAGTRVSLRARELGGVPGNRYELWCIATDGRWVSGGSFRAPGGEAEVVLTAAVGPGDYHRLVVTPEGRRAPKLMRGTLEY
jgi:anti-sigma-K factor RskA